MSLTVLDDHLAPDCRDGKHRACRGDAWCDVTDAPADCDHDCHQAGAA